MKGKQNRKSQRRKDAAVAAQTAEDSANQEALRRRLADAERRQAEATAAMVDVSQQMNMAETVTATLRSEQERVRVIEARQKRELASIQGFTNALRKTMVRPTIISRPGGDEVVFPAEAFEEVLALRDEGIVQLGGEDKLLAQRKFRAMAAKSPESER